MGGWYSFVHFFLKNSPNNFFGMEKKDNFGFARISFPKIIQNTFVFMLFARHVRN